MSNSMERVDARLARIEKRAGYTAYETKNLAAWERQWDDHYGRSTPISNAFAFDREHERLMRESVQADTGRAA
jgi:hypothetical protein